MLGRFALPRVNHEARREAAGRRSRKTFPAQQAPGAIRELTAETGVRGFITGEGRDAARDAAVAPVRFWLASGPASVLSFFYPAGAEVLITAQDISCTSRRVI